MAASSVALGTRLTLLGLLLGALVSAEDSPPGTCASVGWRGPTAREMELVDAAAGCDIDIFEGQLDASLFWSDYAFQRPFIVRGSGYNQRARQLLADRNAFLNQFGETAVLLGDPFELTVYGRSSTEASLREYMTEWSFSPDSPMYLFDRSGGLLESIPQLAERIEPTLPGYFNDSLFAERQAPLIIGIGPSGAGISLHYHPDAWNQVLVGQKHWTFYPPAGLPQPDGGESPGETHLEWLREVRPRIEQRAPPLQCVQREGDMVYVPEGWWHATLNLGDVVCLSQQVEQYTEAAPHWHLSRAQLGLQLNGDSAGGLKEAMASAFAAVEAAPGLHDAHNILGHTLLAAGMRAKKTRAILLFTRRAMEEFGKSVRINSRHTANWLNFGWANLVLRRFSEARQALEQGLVVAREGRLKDQLLELLELAVNEDESIAEEEEESKSGLAAIPVPLTTPFMREFFAG